VARAMQELLARELGRRFRGHYIDSFPDPAFARRIAENPPPD
jgi:hypothetical protein